MMLQHWGAWIVLALAIVDLTGCCSCGPGPIARRTFYDCQCGDTWWNEWYSSPPRCHDQCDHCGDFVGSPNPFVRRGPPPMGRPYDMPQYPASSAPPVESYRTKMEPTPAVEELPSGEPTSVLSNDEYADTVSYERPVDSRPASRKLGNPERAMILAR